MSKKDNESYIEWRDRTINKISPSFCGAKFGNATIWLHSGTTASCHHPLAHKIPLEELQRSHKALHNTNHKKKARRDMLNGIRTPECEACWSVERQDPYLVSDRIFKSIIYPEEKLQEFASQYKDTGDVTPSTLEISFDSLCNLACSYCSQDYSTTWSADLHKNGVYEHLETLGHQVFTQVLPQNAGVQTDGSNPYLEAFWKWWENGLAGHLQELRVTGGEATMSPDFWKLLDWYEAHPREGPKLAVNTNMMMTPNLLNKFINRSHRITNLEIYTSNESVENQSEYIRNGLVWNEWQDNIDQMLLRGKVSQTHCMMTLSALSMFGVVDFIDWVIEKRKERKDKYFLQLSLNVLRFPAFQSSFSVTTEVRRRMADEIESRYKEHWMAPAPREETNYTGFWINEYEKPSVERYIAHLRSEAPANFDFTNSRLDLVRFLNQFDARRKKDWKAVFPRLHADLCDETESRRAMFHPRK